MHKFRYFLFAAILACLLCAQVASAQTNITTLSGNGQIFCSCVNGGGQDPNTGGTYYPLVVLVTDANNRPVANATVNWNYSSATAIQGFFLPGFAPTITTTTSSDGTTSALFLPGGGAFGSPTTPPTSFSVTANISNGATSVFSLTQVYNNTGGSQEADTDLSGIPAASSGNPITANAGQQGFTFNGNSNQSIRVGVLTPGGTPLPGVSVRLANLQTSPSAACVTGQGADPGSVLTDSTGYATCIPVFSGSGTGSFNVAFGGIPLCHCSQDPPGVTPYPPYVDIQSYYKASVAPVPMQVSPAVPSSVTVVSGSGQSATAGQSLPAPLVAVVNTQGGGTLAGQTVTWSVSPAGAATLGNTTTISNASGQVSNTVTLNNSAIGTVTITATLASNASLAATFTATAISAITIGALNKISGDNQSAQLSAQFASPLVVQVVSTANAPVPGIPVSFSANGGAILSATSVTTGSNGQASVTVTASGTAGAITVTATASGFSQTFNLTVSPPGPVLTANSFVNAADQQQGSLSPCSLATINATGLVTGGIQGILSSSLFGLGPLAATLGNDTVAFGTTSAPILNVGTTPGGQQQLTFQVPCTLTPGSNPVTVTVGGGSATTTVNILPASPGVFHDGAAGTSPYPLGVFVRPDGSFVSSVNQARKGETIIAYVTGLGPATPPVGGTNQVPLPTALSMANYTLTIGIANAGVPLVSAQLSPDLVGIYEVAFQVPSNAPSGNQAFSVGATINGKTYYSAGTAIPIL